MVSVDVKHHGYLITYCVTKSGRVWRKVPENDARSVISTRTCRRALTASVDSCAEIKSAHLSGVTKSGKVWRKVRESGARSVGPILTWNVLQTEGRNQFVRICLSTWSWILMFSHEGLFISGLIKSNQIKSIFIIHQYTKHKNAPVHFCLYMSVHTIMHLFICVFACLSTRSWTCSFLSLPVCPHSHGPVHFCIHLSVHMMRSVHSWYITQNVLWMMSSYFLISFFSCWPVSYTHLRAHET